MKSPNFGLDDNLGDKVLEEDELLGEEDVEDEENEGVYDDDEEEVAEVDEKENIPNNTTKEVSQRQSLDGGNNNIKLNKTKKKPATSKLVDKAIKQLNERSGSSAQAIQKFIINENPDMVETRLRMQIKRYLKKSVTDGTMVQIKRSFKFSNKHEMKKKVKPAAKKEKGGEKEKVKKEKKKPEKTEKAPEKKAANIEKKNEKPIDKTKATKIPKKANTVATAEPAKVTKLDKVAKSGKSSAGKKIDKPINKNKSVTLVVRQQTSYTKKMKKKTAKEAKEKNGTTPSVKTTPVVTTPAAVKTGGRGKKK